MLNTPIKASQISNLTDARYFAAWGVEWLGFSLDAAVEGHLAITQIKEIKDWVEGPQMVGEYGLQPISEIKEMAEYLGIDLIQLNDFATVEQAESLQDYTLIKEIVISDLESFGEIQGRVEKFDGLVKHFVLNFKKNNFSWERLSSNVIRLLEELSKNYSIILSIDFTPRELDIIKSKIQFAGLEVLGGVEEKVGLKSFDELDEIFELMEITN